MAQSTAYSYSIVRYVPNPIRDEAINIGAIVIAADGSEAKIKIAPNFQGRIRRVAPEADLALLKMSLQGVQDSVKAFGPQRGFDSIQLWEEADATDPSQWLIALHNRSANRIQFTEPRGGLATSVASALAEIMQEFVELRLPPQGGASNRSNLRRRVSNYLQKKLPGEAFIDRPEITGKHGGHVLDMGFQNGSLKAAMHAVSFHNSRRTEILVHRNNLTLAVQDITLTLPSFRMLALLDSPDQEHQAVHDESLGLFADFGIEALHYNRLEEHAEMLRDLVKDSEPHD